MTDFNELVKQPRGVYRLKRSLLLVLLAVWIINISLSNVQYKVLCSQSCFIYYVAFLFSYRSHKKHTQYCEHLYMISIYYPLPSLIACSVIMYFLFIMIM